MDNKPIARTFRLLSQLMELHEVNPFKIKSIANAAFKIDKLPFPIAGKTTAELEKIDGVGKSIAAKVTELLETGTMAELKEMLDATPEGIVEMLGIKGIGPKKIATIWHDLKIENIGELYYACNENRLIEAKGFGLKTQEEIRKVIEYRMASNGKFLYAQVEGDAERLIQLVKDTMPGALIEFGGEYRRKCEIITELVIVIGSRDKQLLEDALMHAHILKSIHADHDHLSGELESGMLVDLVCCAKVDFHKTLFMQTGTEKHVETVLERIGAPLEIPEHEQLIYQKAGLQFMPPELREDDRFIELARQEKLPQLITIYDLKGTLHNHSTWSDGVNTLEEMALYCRDTMKLEYLGICDHSKSAFYAKGMSIESVLQQHEEIEHLNKKLDGFHIFKGIESDILSDGALDYPEEILKEFDFVVASVHSNLKMSEDKATARLIAAIENPYTTMLGHPTGRLLLSRQGYPIDYKKVIDACADNGVSIEINANPLRLDLDWRWQQYALEKGVWLSINPDAHRTEGFRDMKYGVYVGRKGGLTKGQCVNALSLAEITEFFKKKKLK
jgi:DNA polymerase (family 10)